MGDERVIYRYSLAFKQKVVSEIEEGRINAEDARRIYGIRGGSTIQHWMRRLGKNHLLSRVVRIEMRDEKDRIRELEQQKQELESALAQAHLKAIAWESLVECVEEHYEIDVKKNFGKKAQKRQSKK